MMDGELVKDGLQKRVRFSPKVDKLEVPAAAASEMSEDDDDAGFAPQLALLLTIFTSSAVALALVYWNFPELTAREREHFKLPRDIDDAKQLGAVLLQYRDEHYKTVLVGYLVTYVFLQSFAIPGSIFLSILSGYLFPTPQALLMVCSCSALGASLCYLLSHIMGRRLVRRYIPQRVDHWCRQVDRHRHHLLSYIIFLRITPLLPNWFINITSPIIKVPLSTFFIATFLGVAPPSFVHVQAGTTLHELTSSYDAVSYTSVAVLALFAVLSLLPVVFRGRLEEKLD